MHLTFKITVDFNDSGFFHNFFFFGGGEGLLSGTIFQTRQGRSQMGGDHFGRMSQMRGDLKKLSADEAKNASYRKIRANFGVLSMNSAFGCSFELKSSQN